MTLRSHVAKALPFHWKYKIKKYLGRDRLHNWEVVASKIKDPIDPKARVAFMTASGAHKAGNLLEPALALALKRKNVETAVLLCDEALEACNITEFGNQSSALDTFLKGGPQATKTCMGCFETGFNTWTTTGVQIFRASNFLTPASSHNVLDEVNLGGELIYRGINVKEHVISASLRFLCRGSFDWKAKETQIVVNRYYAAACRAVDISLGFFSEFKPNVIVCFHGIYVPHGVFGEVARSKGIRVINWNTSYRKRRVLFSEDNTYHKAMCHEPESKWNLKLTSDERSTIIDYLGSREDGKNDWQQFNDNPDQNITSDVKLNDFIKSHSKNFLLIPNVIWDAQLQYDASIFETMSDWVVQTIKLMQKIPNRGLIIRVHPAEIRRYSATREPLIDVIKNSFPVGLPENVHIISPEEKHSTYRIAEVCSASIIYGTKTGLELAARKIPVIVCGEAWIKNKGISFDPETIDAYAKLLQSNSYAMTEEMHERALRFAYHFFERTAIELPIWRSKNKDLNLVIDENNLDCIIDGKSVGLECICDEIIAYRGQFIGANS